MRSGPHHAVLRGGPASLRAGVACSVYVANAVPPGAYAEDRLGRGEREGLGEGTSLGNGTGLREGAAPMKGLDLMLGVDCSDQVVKASLMVEVIYCSDGFLRLTPTQPPACPRSSEGSTRIKSSLPAVHPTRVCGPLSPDTSAIRPDRTCMTTDSTWTRGDGRLIGSGLTGIDSGVPVTRTDPPWEGTGRGWTALIRSARDHLEQNVEVVLDPRPGRGGEGHAVVRTLRALREGEELLAWYGGALARHCGVPTLTPANVTGDGQYVCITCGRRFQFPNPLKAHLLFHCRPPLAPLPPVLAPLPPSLAPHYPCWGSAAWLPRADVTSFSISTVTSGAASSMTSFDASRLTSAFESRYQKPNQQLHVCAEMVQLGNRIDDTRRRCFSQHGIYRAVFPNVFCSAEMQKPIMLKTECGVSDKERLLACHFGSTNVKHAHNYHQQVSPDDAIALLDAGGQTAECTLKSLVSNERSTDTTACRSPMPCRTKAVAIKDCLFGAGSGSLLPLSTDSDTSVTSTSDDKRIGGDSTALNELKEERKKRDYASNRARKPSPATLHRITQSVSKDSRSGKRNKGHQCAFCGNLYSRKYGLTIHLRTHSGYKPLRCRVCARPFGDPSNLNKHVRLHACAGGESPYVCAHCGKVLVRRRDLERHMRSRHPTG